MEPSTGDAGSDPNLAATVAEHRDLTLGAVRPIDRPVKAPCADVRFGLVLYGGVSLAIYIYGVVLEFWRLMKASEGREQNAWSGLLREANVTAGVDVISGTSAGGINGVLLAKAIASGGDLERVRRIWVDDADFSELLRPQGESGPRSLLSTEHFERLMTDGLADLDAPLEDRTSLTSVLDVFIAATRLRSWGRPFPTDLGGTIQTRQYRKEFRLRLRTAGYNPRDPSRGYSKNDFVAENNPLLAKVARATSAFPAAFEPQSIDLDDDPSRLLFEHGEPGSAHFSDGGILHNKPFTETLDTILTRAADTRVHRWLVSVEPDPEGRAEAPTGQPEVDEVISKSVFGIPRYQSIAGDLERLEAHRRYAQRQSNLLMALEDALPTSPGGDPGSGETPIDPNRFGAPGVHATERLAQLCADLAREIARAATLAEAGERTVEEGLQQAVERSVLSEEADLSFERRRVYFLLKRLSPSLAEASPAGADARPFAQRLWAQFDRISSALWGLMSQGETGEKVNGMRSLGGEDLKSAAAELASLLAAPLAGQRETVREETAEICADIDEVQRLQGGEPITPARVSFSTAREYYELWDMFLLPADPLLGFARDKIGLARISPKDATFIDKRPQDKLAGDSLGHFGGFLKREWRKNDILWGRLDAAEQIVGMVGVELLEERRRFHIERVQREIVERELPDAPGDYRTYLQDAYCVGSQSLADVSTRKIATLSVDSAGVARNMLAGLEKARRKKVLLQTYRWVGRALGALLAAVRWPVRAIWGDEQPAIRAASIAVLAVFAWSLITAALAVLGEIAVTATLAILVGVGIALFLAWTAIMARAHKSG